MKRFIPMLFLFAPFTAGAATDCGCRDHQIVAEVKAANDGEILEANSVMGRLQTPTVVQFAQKMIQDHTLSNAKLADIIARNQLTPVESEISQMLTQHTQEVIAMLAPLSGLALDRAYMDSQVEDHQTVLNLAKTRWLPEASNPELKAFLMELQTVVTQHLELAIQIRQSLGAMKLAQ